MCGLAILSAATLVGLHATGVSLGYFLQPVAAAIVIGGTFGIVLVTTPGHAIANSARRIREVLASPAPANPNADAESLIAEIISIARTSRNKGPASLETLARAASHPFLRESLLLALDVKDRSELVAALETDLRLRERQGEADAKTLEVAGGFAPTIGILGTVIGLIEVLRQFSGLQGVAGGIGTAFVSTIYGLALANFVLLPLAHRIRARVAEAFETQELMIEGVLCIFDQVHPSLMRCRLNAFSRGSRKDTGGELVPAPVRSEGAAA